MRKNMKKIPVTIRAALVGGAIAAAYTLITQAVQCRESARANRKQEFQELADNLASLDAAISGEFQVYLSLAGKLAGKTVYGPEHLEELGRINKYPDTFVENTRKNIEKAAAVIKHGGFGGKAEQVIRTLHALKKTDALLVDLFYETGPPLQWKREPLKAALVIHIYRVQIGDELQGLYREARRLYEAY